MKRDQNQSSTTHLGSEELTDEELDGVSGGSSALDDIRRAEEERRAIAEKVEQTQQQATTLEERWIRTPKRGSSRHLAGSFGSFRR